MKYFALLGLLLVATLPVFAQTTAHTAKFAYTASTDSTTQNPGTVTAFAANGACGTTQTFASVQTGGPASATVANPFTVNLSAPGTYCFYLEAVIGGASSTPSSSVGGSANPFPPTAVTVVVQ